jgi:hypothetical protein
MRTSKYFDTDGSKIEDKSFVAVSFIIEMDLKNGTEALGLDVFVSG